MKADWNGIFDALPNRRQEGSMAKCETETREGYRLSPGQSVTTEEINIYVWGRIKRDDGENRYRRRRNMHSDDAVKTN